MSQQNAIIFSQILDQSLLPFWDWSSSSSHAMCQCAMFVVYSHILYCVIVSILNIRSFQGGSASILQFFRSFHFETHKKCLNFLTHYVINSFENVMYCNFEYKTRCPADHDAHVCCKWCNPSY